MEARFAGFKVVRAKYNSIEWRGTITPAALSDTYLVSVAYQIPLRPKIRILEPELRLFPGKTKLPHVFSDGTICVHLHEEWNARMIIAETIIPWIPQWLYFYEVWQFTGEWEGKGHGHPDEGKS